MTSIRRLMLISLIGTMSLVMAVAGYFSYRAGLQEAGEMFDAKLAHSARVLVSLVDQPLDELVAHGPTEPVTIKVWHGAAKGVGDDLVFPSGHAYETKLAFQVRDQAGRLLLRSDSGPDRALAPLESGYRNVRIDGDDWRSFTMKAPSGNWYQAGELSDIRRELAEDIAIGTLLPLLVALPILAVLVWLIVTWTLRNLIRLSRQIEQREPGNLAALDLEKVPREVRGVVQAVNGLMQRLDSALTRERRFTADVAHELRTPISALKVHADNVCMARDASERGESQALLQRSVVRLEHLVSQMLSLSRVDEGAGLRASVPVDMDSLVRQQIIDHQAAAAGRGITIDLRSAPVQVTGDPVALDSLVRNLLDNAIRYTPEDGRVRVTLAPHATNARLEVEDSGPGIPPEARQRVFSRFHRELGTGVEGNGLGLAIVRNVLALHRGRVELDTSAELGGLHVIAEMPLQ